MGLVDEDIATLLARNLDAYYERLVSFYWHQLLAFAYRRTGSTQDAEDIVQESFVRAYLALERYPEERIRTLKVRPWLYKVTWSVYCNYTGRSKSPPLVPLDLSEDGPLMEREEYWSEQPEKLFEHVERRQELEELVNSLPPRYREIVSLYYFDELSHQEIAEMLNQRVGTIKVYVHRGIRMLRKAVVMQTNEVR